MRCDIARNWRNVGPCRRSDLYGGNRHGHRSRRDKRWRTNVTGRKSLSEACAGEEKQNRGCAVRERRRSSPEGAQGLKDAGPQDIKTRLYLGRVSYFEAPAEGTLSS